MSDCGVELIKELDRSRNTILPPYNEKLVEKVFEEIRQLYSQNEADIKISVENESQNYPIFPSIIYKHTIITRRKRCLISYMFNRLMRIKDIRWKSMSVIGEDQRKNLSPAELEWLTGYSSLLADYMVSLGDFVDLTQYNSPPKSLYIKVRCGTDYGEIVTTFGERVMLAANTEHYLLRTDCEHLIRLGILEHVV